jgi:DNA-binding response OmpR family regulator
MICDDNVSVHESLIRYLQPEGVQVISAYDGESAWELFRLQHLDLIILDIMLPGISGAEVCGRIRQSSNVPIIMLSARGEEYDRITGLELGADDYVTKPFSPREVLTRVRSILRRQNIIQEEKKYHCAELTVVPDAYEVYVNSEKIEMRPKEFGVLSYLISNAGKVLSREQILNAVWGYESYGDARVVDTQVKRIRQKLGAGHIHFSIRTIYGAGYKLEETK